MAFPRVSLLPIALLLAIVSTSAQSSSAPRGPDDRYKADLLLMVAHPDDDVLAGTYLARLVLDQGKRVAVVFATPGDSGGNQNGPERAASLGLERQIEVRRDLATLGIVNVWFLSGHDTAGQDPVRSLANWNHGRVLGEAVRLIRLTRPEVVLSWLPMQVAGENHGDHQASSVLATEAFDLAGDPTAFPEQVAYPVQQFEPLLEGLRPWQAKKLYFMSDAIDTAFMEGQGPSYSIKEVSAARHVPYWQLAYEQLRAHVTQYRGQLEALAATDQAGRERMLVEAAPGDALLEPLRLVRGKSHVPGPPTGDVFENITDRPLAFVPPADRAAAPAGISLELGGPWAYYRLFWQAHGLRGLEQIARQEIGPVSGGTDVRIPLLVRNATGAAETAVVTAVLPQGWQETQRANSVVVPASGDAQIVSVVKAPPAASGRIDLSYQLTIGATRQPPVKVTLVMQPGSRPLPQ